MQAQRCDPFHPKTPGAHQQLLRAELELTHQRRVHHGGCARTVGEPKLAGSEASNSRSPSGRHQPRRIQHEPLQPGNGLQVAGVIRKSEHPADGDGRTAGQYQLIHPESHQVCRGELQRAGLRVGLGLTECDGARTQIQ